MEPLAPARCKVSFTASAELREKLERLQALMRSSVPDGDLARIIDMAVTEKLERVEAKRFAKTKKPRKGLAETDTGDAAASAMTSSSTTRSPLPAAATTAPVT